MTTVEPRNLRSWRDVLRAPLVIFIMSVAGLAMALLGDGWWHWLSWLLVAVPLAVITLALARTASVRPPL